MLKNASIYLLLFVSLSVSGAETAPHYQVKAAFIYNFIKFVEWPPVSFDDSAKPYVVGVLGKDPFGSVLETTMRGKTVNGRSIITMRIDETEINQCHVIFISSSERKRLPQIFNQIGSHPVLTIGETEEFAETGGVINFYLEQNKVRFEINIDAAKRSEFKIHSTLLNLAKVVRSNR